jgi:hypothetical protein
MAIKSNNIFLFKNLNNLDFGFEKMPSGNPDLYSNSSHLCSKNFYLVFKQNANFFVKNFQWDIATPSRTAYTRVSCRRSSPSVRACPGTNFMISEKLRKNCDLDENSDYYKN